MHPRRIIDVLLVALVLLAYPSGAALAASPATELAPYTAAQIAAPGVTVTQAETMNAHGDVVGTAEFGSGASATPCGFLWHNGTLSELPQPSGATCGSSGTTSAWALNDGDLVVGTADYRYTGSQDEHPFAEGVEQASTWQGISPPANLGSQCSDDAGIPGASEAFSVNNGGTVGGTVSECPGSGFSGAVPEDAWLGTPSHVIALGDTSGGRGDAETISVNNSGQALVYYDSAGSDAGPSADLYSAGALHQLPVLPTLFANGGTASGSQAALNDSGVVVGVDLGTGAPAYSVNAGPAVTLSPADGLPGGLAIGVNANGDVVGSSINAGATTAVATVWPASAPPAKSSVAAGIDLNTLIPAGQGINLTSATAINASGQILAGGTINGIPGWFVLTCAAQSASKRAAMHGDRAGLTAPSGILPGCPLFMKITEGDTQQQSPFDLMSGLSLTRHPASAAGIQQSDIAFKTGSLDAIADGETFPGRCVSGCTDMMATVGEGQSLDEHGNPTGIVDPVTGADVTATITGVSTNSRITNTNADPGWICTVEAPGSSPSGATVTKEGLTCSTTSVTAETDSAGQARFRYWGPAAWGSPNDPRPQVHLSFQARATRSCSSISCSAAQSNVNPVLINVKPQVIWWRDAHLTTLERSILVEWSQGDAIGSGLQKFASTLSKLKVFDNLKLLKALKTASKRAKLTGRASDTVMLLWFIRKFGLVTDGLYSEVNFAAIQDQLLGLVKNPAASALARKLASELFGQSHLFDQEVIKILRTYGGVGPGTLGANVNDHNAYTMTLKAYEASYCSGSDFWCGGESNEALVSAGLVKGQGVHFNAYFAFSSEDVTSGLSVFFGPGRTTFNLDTGYIPRTWITAQCRVLCVGYGEPAPPD